jgi:predicted DNA binding CopG/RHH family protein
MMSSKKETKKAYGRYEEPKERVNMTLTQTAIQALDETSALQGLGRSELVERWARGLTLDVTPQEAFLLGE